MWIVRVDTAAQAAKKGSQAKPARIKFVPLPVGKTLKLGRGVENDVVVDHQSVSKTAGRIILGSWEDKVNKQGKVTEVPIEYWNDTQVAGSKLTLEQVQKDESKQKPVTVLHPHEGTPRDAEGRISTEAVDADYQELNEWGKIEIEDGTVVHLTKSAKLVFTWRSYVFADTDQTAAKIELAQRLRGWGISHQKKIFPGLTTHVAVPEISVANDLCLEAVSSAIYIVRSDFLNQLLKALESVSPQDGVLLPSESACLPAVSIKDGQGNKITDARSHPSWWEPNRERRTIWDGTTVLVLGGAKKSQEDVFLKNGGAPVQFLDVTTRPPRNAEDFKKKIKPLLTAATALHEEVKQALLGLDGMKDCSEWPRPPMVMLYRDGVLQAIQDKWEGDEELMEVFIEAPKSLGIPVEFSQNWWMGLTKPDCMTIFEETEDVSSQMTNRLPATQKSTQPASRSRMLGRADTEIPSTHPDEDASLHVSQESTEPAPPAGRVLLKRRAGGKNKFSMFDDSDSDEAAPPAKRTRTQAQSASALPSQVPNTGTSTSEPMELDRGIATSSVQSRNGLKRRAGTLSKNSFFDFDDSRNEDDEPETSTNDPLAKFRQLYDSNKNKSGVPDSMPPDGMDYEELYTQAKSQARATVASQMEVDSSNNEDDDDGFLAHLKRKTLAEKKKKSRTVVEDIPEEDEEEEPEERDLSGGPSRSTGTVPQLPSQEEFRPTQKTLPTLPENVSKDETFLKAANKVKRGSNKVDEFDMEFNALKISKPTKASIIQPTTASKVRQTDEELYRLLEDMDTSTTGNFIVIERVDLYRKDKEAAAAERAAAVDPAWAGKKNFKKFKKQPLAVKKDPIPMTLKSTVDYGLGKAYWANEGVAAPTAEPPTQSQMPSATQSQARTAASTSQSTQPMAKGKRKLLAADSDDDDIPVRPVRRTGRTQMSATPEPTPAATATRTRRGRTTTPSEAEDVPAPKPTRGRKKAVAAIPSIFEDDEEEAEVQVFTPVETTATTSGTRRGTRAGPSRSASILGESTQAEDIMPLRGSSTVTPAAAAASGTGTAAASGTGRANRKRMILDSDDDDMPILVPAKKRKKH